MATTLQSGAAPPAQGMNNLTTLIKRLEAATSRLEDIASTTDDSSGNHALGVPSGSNPQASSSAPELAHEPPKEPLPKSVEEMDELIHGDVRKFTDAGRGLGKSIENQASGVAKAFADQRRFILTTTKAKKPDQQSKDFMELLKDLQQDMSSVGDAKESNRAPEVKEHVAMVAEGISALQWLVMPGKPADYVTDVIGGAQYHGNRVLQAHKEGDQAHATFVKAYYAVLKNLQAFIKKHYPTGITWNNNGSDDVLQVYREADADADSAPTINSVPAPSPGGGAPPPPPPPLPNFDNAPPPPPPGPAPAPQQKSGGDMDAVFSQLNQGSAVTAGLKKVDKSQMTHKNPSLRATLDNNNETSRSRSPGPEIKPKPQSMRQNSTASNATAKASPAAADKPKKEPKKALEGKQWFVENFDSPSAPIELDVDLPHAVLISNCRNATIVLRGKCNALSVMNCTSTQILLDSLVSAVDAVKCAKFAVQIQGRCPTVLLDQVDGASVFLSEEGAKEGECEVLSSKSSAVNVVLPPGGEEDSVECPVPEQLRTVVKGRGVVSEVVEHAG